MAAVGLTAAFAAHAQWGASVALDSDYRVRGVPLSNLKPALRATLSYDAPDDWYAGVTTARVELARGDRYLQVVPYAGRLWRLDARRRVEGGATYAHFTGDTRYDFAEVYAGLLTDTWSVRAFYAPSYFGRGVRTAYLEWNGHAAIGTAWRLFGHVGALQPLGHTQAGAGRSRLDVRGGAAVSIGDVDLQLARVAVNSREGPYPALYGGRRAAWVASAAFGF